MCIYIYTYFTSIVVYSHGNAEKPINQWTNALTRDWAGNDTDAEDCATWGVRVFGHLLCGWWFFTGGPGYRLPFLEEKPTHELRDVGFCHPQIFWLCLVISSPCFIVSIEHLCHPEHWQHILHSQPEFNTAQLVLVCTEACFESFQATRRGLLCPIVSFLC